ncbi:MAG: DUF4440 domain-containing protein [candidate division Zixibacteria bacterium]
MKYLYVLILVLIASVSFADDKNIADKEQLMIVDQEFSQMSVDSGIGYAFDFYMADSATVLTEGSLPITGRDAINAMYDSLPEGARLTWEPIFADIAASDDLGYTIGSWTYSVSETAGTMSTASGYYITIWKRQDDGSWKYVFDTGTDGPKE